MTARQARKAALAALPWLRSAMMLNSWRVNLEWVDLEPGLLARCSTDARYRVADVEIDARQHETEARILSTLRHELAHILHAEFKLFELATSHLLSKPARESLGEVYDAAQEKTAVGIEMMLEQGLGLRPEKMIAMAKRRAR